MGMIKESSTYCIYVLENKLNGKKYIGQTMEFKKRMNSYKRLDCKKQRKLYNALLKYGFEGFESKIILSGLTLEEANEVEIYMIAYCGTVVYGYNISEGGGGTKGVKGPRPERRLFSEEQELGILNEYKNGLSGTDLKRIYKCSSCTVYNVLKKHNIDRRSCKIFTDKEELKILSSYKKVGSFEKVSVEFGCSPQPIKDIIKKHKCKYVKIPFFTKEQELEIVAKSKNKHASIQIATLFNCSIYYILNVLKKYNASTSFYKKLTVPEKFDIIERFHKGQSARSIAKEYNSTHGVILGVIKNQKQNTT